MKFQVLYISGQSTIQLVSYEIRPPFFCLKKPTSDQLNYNINLLPYALFFSFFFFLHAKCIFLHMLQKQLVSCLESFNFLYVRHYIFNVTLHTYCPGYTHSAVCNHTDGRKKKPSFQIMHHDPKKNLLYVQHQVFLNIGYNAPSLGFSHIELKEHCNGSLQGGLDTTNNALCQTIQNFHLNFKASKLLVCLASEELVLL